ncbi:hypothetical protein B4U79_04488 [Dinothrombium tinctorium]|uniref:Uncharacterized protein n=1 Tax=Dinothrombium tinctorium TaxID=1965070 RepID=A0A443RL34_9ACAR|nr:hypothetical protein B4U79_04488 [Dinothrombium tinctorium]
MEEMTQVPALAKSVNNGLENSSRVTQLPYSYSSRATHPPYPYTAKAVHVSIATHPPYPYTTRAPHVSIATHPPFPPLKKNQESPAKKQLFPLDAELLKVWLKEAISYFTAPFLMPISITKALQTPAGLQSNSRTFWSKVMQSLRMAFLKRSSQISVNPKPDITAVLKRMKEGLHNSKLWQSMKKQDKSGRRDDLNLISRWRSNNFL